MLTESDARRFADGRRAHAGTAVELIAEELATHRARGFTASADARLLEGELPAVAACFLFGGFEVKAGCWPEEWPRGLLLDKSRVKQLVIAGALIAAEIERLQAEAMVSLSEGTKLPPVIEI
ncbi:hypothetical protein [Cupriavidus sp. TMH.W2]|uniref:hypothetical protein n=1 Tax=Cupriavidus sp. TMH.W2 TaxID=3434465 RepID=UPI003D77AEBA